MNRLAVQALEKMETRKFNSKSKGRREGSCGALDTLSSGSTSDCAICLEKYIDGEVVTETRPLSGEGMYGFPEVLGTTMTRVPHNLDSHVQAFTSISPRSWEDTVLYRWCS